MDSDWTSVSAWSVLSLIARVMFACAFVVFVALALAYVLVFALTGGQVLAL